MKGRKCRGGNAGEEMQGRKCREGNEGEEMQGRKCREGNAGEEMQGRKCRGGDAGEEMQGPVEKTRRKKGRERKMRKNLYKRDGLAVCYNASIPCVSSFLTMRGHKKFNVNRPFHTSNVSAPFPSSLQNERRTRVQADVFLED